MKNDYNPTCLVTGSTEKLQMYPLRNNNGEMIGWIFLSQSVDVLELDSEIVWKYKVAIKNENT